MPDYGRARSPIYWTSGSRPRHRVGAPATVSHTRSIIDCHLNPPIGHLDLDKLTTVDIDDFYGYLLRGDPGRSSGQRSLSERGKAPGLSVFLTLPNAVQSQGVRCVPVRASLLPYGDLWSVLDHMGDRPCVAKT